MKRTRRIWLSLATVIILALFLGSCAPAAAPTPTPAPPKPGLSPTAAPVPKPAAPSPKYGGTITRLLIKDLDHLDPHQARGSADWQEVLGHPYNRLLKYDANLELAPDLAESWELPDSKTYILHLRKGVKFQNLEPVKGRELVADDVKYSIQRIATDDPNYFRRQQFTMVDRIETPDKYTVKITLKQPTAAFINYLAQPFNVIVPREAVEKHGDLTKVAIGTGPFILKEYRPKVGYTLVRNPDYFIKELPYLDGINVAVVPDAASRKAYFRAKEADFLGVVQSELKDLQKTIPDLQVQRYPRLILFLAFKPDKPPFNDQRVRSAISLALNRQQLIDVAFEGDAFLLGPVLGPGPAWLLPQDELRQRYKVDVAKAKELLAQAGFAGGLTIHVNISSARQDALSLLPLVIEQLKQVGVKVEPEVMEHTTVITKRNKGDYDVLIHANSPAEEPADQIMQSFRKGGMYHIDDPELERLLQAQEVEVDIKKRQEIFHQFERTFLDRAYWLPLLSYYEYMVCRPSVKNWHEPSTFSKHLLHEVWLEK